MFLLPSQVRVPLPNLLGIPQRSQVQTHQEFQHANQVVVLLGSQAGSHRVYLVDSPLANHLRSQLHCLHRSQATNLLQYQHHSLRFFQVLFQAVNQVYSLLANQVVCSQVLNLQANLALNPLVHLVANQVRAQQCSQLADRADSQVVSQVCNRLQHHRTNQAHNLAHSL